MEKEKMGFKKGRRERLNWKRKKKEYLVKGEKEYLEKEGEKDM